MIRAVAKLGMLTRLLDIQRGTVTAEYTVVLVLVALGCASATAAIFPRLAELFRVQTLVLSLPAIF